MIINILNIIRLSPRVTKMNHLSPNKSMSNQNREESDSDVRVPGDSKQRSQNWTEERHVEGSNSSS